MKVNQNKIQLDIKEKFLNESETKFLNFRNELKGSAQGLGLPTFIVSDAGRTQVSK